MWTSVGLFREHRGLADAVAVLNQEQAVRTISWRPARHSIARAGGAQAW